MIAHMSSVSSGGGDASRHPRGYPQCMAGLSYQTAGESHGPALITVITGLPAGIELDLDLINSELARRQGGYGRGGRQRASPVRTRRRASLRASKSVSAQV